LYGYAQDVAFRMFETKITKTPETRFHTNKKLKTSKNRRLANKEIVSMCVFYQR